MIEGIDVGLDVKNPWLRSELAAYLASQPDVRLQTSEGTGRLDLIILEVDEEPAKTLALVHALRSASPATAIFLTSPHTEPDVLLEFWRAGIRDFIPQPLNKEELTRALQRLRSQPREPQQVKRGKLINLMGSKGGLGTTTIAVNLALSLQETETQ